MGRRTRRAMELSRGLILGRVWTTMRHFVMGSLAITLGMMALTGHVYVAMGIAVGMYCVLRIGSMVVHHLMRLRDAVH